MLVIVCYVFWLSEVFPLQGGFALCGPPCLFCTKAKALGNGDLIRFPTLKHGAPKAKGMKPFGLRWHLFIYLARMTKYFDINLLLAEINFFF